MGSGACCFICKKLPHLLCFSCNRARQSCKRKDNIMSPDPRGTAGGFSWRGSVWVVDLDIVQVNDSEDLDSLSWVWPASPSITRKQYKNVPEEPRAVKPYHPGTGVLLLLLQACSTTGPRFSCTPLKRFKSIWFVPLLFSSSAVALLFVLEMPSMASSERLHTKASNQNHHANGNLPQSSFRDESLER